MSKSASKHWMQERIVSVVMLPLTIAMVWIVGPLIGEDYETVKAALSRPVVALILMVFFIVGAKHLQDGIQVVLEDYVHGSAFQIMTLLNKIFCWLMALVAFFALLNIAFLGG
ncbi:MAG: succinate dehydrogenase, hydrophobic membrane anchor protein [Pseudomonadota bacterium]